MILLDTNVISEALKPGGAPAVLAWIDAQALETLHLCTITLVESRTSSLSPRATQAPSRPQGWR